MDEASIVLNVPFDRTTVSGFRVSLDASDLTVHSCRGLDKIAFIIGDTRRGAVIKHKCLRVRVELTTWQCAGRPICPCCSHDGNGFVVRPIPRDFLALRRLGPAFRVPCVRRLRRTFMLAIAVTEGCAHPLSIAIMDLIHVDLWGRVRFGT